MASYGYDARSCAEKAHPIFVANNWVWGLDPEHVPSVDEIEDAIKFLIKTCEEEIVPAGKTNRCETGRLFAEVEEDDGSIKVGIVTTLGWVNED